MWKGCYVFSNTTPREENNGPAAVAMGLFGKSKEKKATEAATIERRADAHEDGPIDNPCKKISKLHRFVQKQAADHECALRELLEGQKMGCWSWWIFPTPPFISNGRRCGSGLNKVYEIVDDEEGLAYLKLAQLRSNYLQIVAAVNEALEAGVEPKKLLGIDVPRVEASARYFEYLAGKAEDAELALACRTALDLLAGAATKKQDKLDAKKRDFLEARKREHDESDSMSRKKVRADHATAGGPVPEAPQDGTSGATTSEEAASEVAASEEASGVSATSAPTNGAPPSAGTDERDA